MKKTAALLLAILAVACLKKDANGNYRVNNPMASKEANAKAHDNAAKSGQQVDRITKKVEQGADKAAVKAGEVLEKAGRKLKEKAKSDAQR
jgi:hypothetical protein